MPPTSPWCCGTHTRTCSTASTPPPPGLLVPRTGVGQVPGSGDRRDTGAAAHGGRQRFPAALFRAVSGAEGRPTILFDEIDTVFGPKAGDNEELRGFLNAGHRRGQLTYRCVGDGGNQSVQGFPSYCGVAVAGLGSLPDTILTRSVIIRMRRRARNEHVEPFRHRLHAAEGHVLRDRLAKWAESVRPMVEGVFPLMPEEVTDRPADVWEPLIAIADAAGGQWPERARAACVELVNAAKVDDKGSIGIRLLTDLRDHVLSGIDRLPTVAVLERLHSLDEAPWADMGGRPMDARGLAKMLREYMTSDNRPIAARNIKASGSVMKGYYSADLADAWQRYCPPPLKVRYFRYLRYPAGQSPEIGSG